ncbi:MAG: hypothetical protein HZA53_18255 [Planctomycetes bacterium]|nr:hypothetical protein [Planctomycetota bacterium]
MTAIPTRSASGLRPAAAFVLVGSVLVLVAARAVKTALADDGEQPRNLTQLPMPEVTFDLVDSDGTPLAISVDRLELVMSPNAMWQAHTPGRLAQLLAERLGPPYTAQDLIKKLLPDRARDGLVHARKAPLRLDREAAQRVVSWLARGTNDPEAPSVAVEGLWVLPTPSPDEFELVWDPVTALSEGARDAHRAKSTIDWTRKIADGLIAAVHGGAAAELTDTEEKLTHERKRIWDALLPTQFKSVVKEVSPQAAIAVFDLLKDEHVQKHQMELVRNKKRMYPVQGGAIEDPPAEVLGRWGTLEPEKARAVARKELLLPDDELCTEQQLSDLADLTRAKVYQPSPMWGLELCAQARLRDREWEERLERRSEEYLFLANQVPRQTATRVFQALTPASETPRVVTSLDLDLQRVVRLELERTLADNDPVLAQAIVLEVATGRVLAVDALDNYEMSGFLPTMHTFTPGSTMKAVVMTAALDQGVVRPDEPFRPFGGHFKIGPREIHEAEGQKKESPWVTASEGLAFSLNGVLVQIGLRVDDERLHQYFRELGYASYPNSGLGGERCGMLPPLPWKPAWSHASVCFGHEMLVTLWQHAASLATLVRGGEYLPLRLVDRVEQKGQSWEIASALPRRVFRAEACEQVREMMKLGAQQGTGSKVNCTDLVMGTKTGTAQKVPGEVCLHVEAQHHMEHAGCTGSKGCREKLQGLKAHKGPCYTSSMCAWGRLPGDPRELLVLVVVDEPRKGKKFGADVAGPAAAAILKEALGHTHGGVLPEAIGPEGFQAFQAPAAQLSDRPWMEVSGAPR